MRYKIPFKLCTAAALALLCVAGPASAQHHGGYRGGFYGGYGYRPYGYGFYPGWYRPYPFIGIGVGFYAPYYGSYAYPLPAGYAYPAYPYGVVAGSAPAGAVPPAQGGAAQPTERPPADNAGHLQLIVPDNAEVSINGQKIANQSGTTREIVTPTLQPGTRYTYKIAVRTTNAQGKLVEDTRDITFQANDWFSIDFTRPAPPQAPAAPPQPLPNPLR